MFARRIRVLIESEGQRSPAPLKALDSFAMRNFTNDPIFDDTLPISDGEMQIGARVPLERLREALEEWFRRKSFMPKDAKVVVSE